MSIEIGPSTLEFAPPFTQPTTRSITITNLSDETAAFKVKTTAPKLYCVRPNAALVEPGKSVDVSIILLGLKEEPSPDFKCNDKFLIVALPAPYDIGENTVADVWPKLEAEFKPQSVSKKIKVKYVYDQPNQESNGAITTGSAVSGSGATGAAGAVPVGSSKSSAPISEKQIEQDDSDLSKDQSKIDALNEKLDSNVAASSSKNSTQLANKSNQSIGNAPLTTVILIALAAFIIGWLFFLKKVDGLN